MEIRRRAPAPPVEVDILTYQVKLPEAEPRHILEEIVWHKNREVDRLRAQVPLAQLRQQVAAAPAPQDFVGALRNSADAVALIAEVKKASPSKGVICENFDPVAIAQAYEAGGASCLSVLTDQKFFQGSGDYLRDIRAAVDLPILCKEFILFPYQLFWARSLGADAVLLIAKILSDSDLKYFLAIIERLGMAALVEVHTLAELDRVLTLDGVRLVGINNRNLTDFTVDLSTTAEIAAERKQALVERDILLVGESGIHTPDDLRFLQARGVRAVLVGESLVATADPAAAVRSLLETSA
ncbi:indole-3-glycerol phosphate synthase TrpC [Synechococcus sp. PCC 7336]|uniref:indole-3-glycerol phosphate synthase TrpC n=1 Tax=Synechococcus sp. PCC 7336 TaxID=195250 RepID=UPI00047602D0|nr:indole-3-glycerol phosphate synthase TrpC [Synechococcus sp. PCC 7336]